MPRQGGARTDLECTQRGSGGTRRPRQTTGAAAAYGWGYALATTRGELDEALTGRIDGPQLVVVPLPR